MEWDLEIKDGEFIPQNRKPTEETVCYKIGALTMKCLPPVADWNVCGIR